MHKSLTFVMAALAVLGASVALFASSPDDPFILRGGAMFGSCFFLWLARVRTYQYTAKRKGRK